MTTWYNFWFVLESLKLNIETRKPKKPKKNKQTYQTSLNICWKMIEGTKKPADTDDEWKGQHMWRSNQPYIFFSGIMSQGGLRVGFMLIYCCTKNSSLRLYQYQVMFQCSGANFCHHQRKIEIFVCALVFVSGFRGFRVPGVKSYGNNKWH